MSTYRGNATAAGWFFIVAAVAAIAGLALYQPALSDPAYVLGAGSDGRVLLGGFLEVVLAASCIGTAVALYPVVKRESESAALGYVCGRLLEAAVITTGIAATLSLVTLRGAGGSTEVARALIAVHDWTFLLGPGLVIGVNSLLLAWLVHRSRLVPRWIAVLGLVGGPLVFRLVHRGAVRAVRGHEPVALRGRHPGHGLGDEPRRPADREGLLPPGRPRAAHSRQRTHRRLTMKL